MSQRVSQEYLEEKSQLMPNGARSLMERRVVSKFSIILSSSREAVVNEVAFYTRLTNRVHITVCHLTHAVLTSICFEGTVIVANQIFKALIRLL